MRRFDEHVTGQSGVAADLAGRPPGGADRRPGAHAADTADTGPLASPARVSAALASHPDQQYPATNPSAAGSPYPPAPPESARRNGSGDKDPAELLDRLSPRTLAPPPKPQPSRGWRRALLRSTGGLVNPGLSRYEAELRDDVRAIRGLLRGPCYKIGVFVGKGGTGKSTIATLVSSILAEFRSDDTVVAIDADPSFGKLADRIAPDTTQTYWDLLSDEAAGRLTRWSDLKAHLGSNAATGLWVLRGERRTQRRRLIDAGVYRATMGCLDRYANIAVIDCGQVLEHPVMDAILPDLNAAVIVGAIEPGAGLATGETLAWLAGAGYHMLVREAVIVLNDPRGRASRHTRAALLRDFTAHADGTTVLMPFDEHLSAGGVVDSARGVSARTRRASIEIAAHVARGFANTTLEPVRR